MADVIDRGQIIIVTGLLVAVALVALALILNTVIFTQNLASRGSDIGGQDALEFRQVVSGHVAGLLAEENDKDYATNSSVRENVTDGVDQIESILRRSYIHRSVVADISNLTLHNGSRLQQTDDTQEMTSASGAINWTLATGVPEPREFVVNITDETTLNETDDPANEYNQTFRITVENGGDEWNLYVYEDTSDSKTEIAVENASDSNPTVDVCSPSNTPRIDLLNGTVDGNPCSAIVFAKGVSAPYDITYTWGNRSVGNYTLTVNVSGSGSTPSSNFDDPGSGQPFEAHIVYSADFDVLYQTNRLQYRQVVHVVPEGSS